MSLVQNVKDYQQQHLNNTTLGLSRFIYQTSWHWRKVYYFMIMATLNPAHKPVCVSYYISYCTEGHVLIIPDCEVPLPHSIIHSTPCAFWIKELLCYETVSRQFCTVTGTMYASVWTSKSTVSVSLTLFLWTIPLAERTRALYMDAVIASQGIDSAFAKCHL